MGCTAASYYELDSTTRALILYRFTAVKPYVAWPWAMGGRMWRRPSGLCTVACVGNFSLWAHVSWVLSSRVLNSYVRMSLRFTARRLHHLRADITGSCGRDVLDEASASYTSTLTAL